MVFGKKEKIRGGDDGEMGKNRMVHSFDSHRPLTVFHLRILFLTLTEPLHTIATPWEMVSRLPGRAQT
jgi:hypothetical protein